MGGSWGTGDSDTVQSPSVTAWLWRLQRTCPVLSTIAQIQRLVACLFLSGVCLCGDIGRFSRGRYPGWGASVTSGAHQRRVIIAAPTAPAVLIRTSSTDENLPSSSTY